MALQLNSKRWLAQLNHWLFHTEPSRQEPLHYNAWCSARVLYAVGRDVFTGHITLHAMGLVYTTLLSIVPFLALSFSVLKGFGVHNQLEPLLLTWTAPLGERAPEIVNNVVNFVDNYRVGVLGSVGFGLLIYTVISLVQKIERSFNEIWRVSQLRSLGQRFSNYLSVIIVGPVLIFSAMGATTALVGSDMVTDIIEIRPFGWLYSLLSAITPYFMIVGLFTFVYTFIPNTRVKLKYAFIGGLVGGVLWQTMGIAFASFFAMSTSYGRYAAIYSGFAIGIVTLLWLYISWLILLLGSSISYYAQHINHITRKRQAVSSAMVDEHAGLTLVYLVATKFDSRGGGTPLTELEAKLAVGPETITRIRHKLLKHEILSVGGENAELLLPARPLDRITLDEVLRALRCPDTPMPPALTREKSVTQITRQLAEAQDETLAGLTLASWVREDVAPADANPAADPATP